MKKKIQFLILASGFMAFGQTTVFDSNYNHVNIFERVLKEELQSYYSIESDGTLKSLKAVQSRVLNENIKNAFNTIIFSNSDLVTNSSAFGYTQNTEKTKVTLNTNIKIGSTKNYDFYGVFGSTIEGSNSVFEFYSEDSWNNNISLNTIFIIKPTKNSGQFYTINDKKKKNRVSKRAFYTKKHSKLVNKLNDPKIFKKIEEIQSSLSQYYDSKKVLKNCSNELLLFPKVAKLIKNDKIDEAFSEIEKQRVFLEKIHINTKKDNNLKMFIQKEILYKFDKEEDITQGYYFPWIRIGNSLGNGTYSFNEDSIDPIILQNNNTFTEDINKLSSSTFIDYNYISNNKDRILFYQLGKAINTGSILNNNLISGSPNLFEEANQVLIRDDNNTLGRFNQIQRTLSTGSIYSYAAIFFAADKKLGLNVSLKYDYLINKPTNVFYKNNYTILFGPLFRTVKNDNTSISFGIDIGWENAIYDAKASDYFTGRIRLGIPFGIYKKAKKSEKK